MSVVGALSGAQRHKFDRREGAAYNPVTPQGSTHDREVPKRMSPSETILQTLRQHRHRLKELGVARIGLFGSYAEGCQTEESDIDILVEFAPGQKTFDNYMDLKFFLEDALGDTVDLVIADAVRPELAPYIRGSVKYAAGSAGYGATRRMAEDCWAPGHSQSRVLRRGSRSSLEYRDP